MRITRSLLLAAIGSIAGLGGYAAAQQLSARPALPPEFRAYLPSAGVVLADYVPEVAPGSVEDRYDRAVFKATRKLAGSPRWALAQADSGRGALKAFSCAAGANLTSDNVPALVRLLSRYRTDLINATRLPATGAARPYQRDHGAVCLADKALANAGTTPAIQSAWGWTLGLVLAEALPERTDALMARARAYGDSAAICGFASEHEVRGGRELASALLARSRAVADFEHDLAVAKAQVATVAGSNGAAPEGCAAERALITVGRQ